MNRISRIVGPLLLLLCAGIVTNQFLIRPAVGIAANGDIPKTSGPVALGPATGTWPSRMFVGFFYTYAHRPDFRYNSPFSTAELVSSELLLVKLARALQKILQP